MLEKKKYNIAVVGASGNVGREILEILHEEKFPFNDVYALASQNSFGKQMSFGEKIITVDLLENFDFSKVDIAFFSAGSAVSEVYVPIATSKGCYVIDNTSFFRMQDGVPLIIPEVNPKDIKLAEKTKIIANPNCSTIQMLVALAKLHKDYKIKRIVASTYQAVSGKGRAAMDELYYQTKAIYETSSVAPEQFTRQIAFNCIPHIDEFLEDGKTKEEWKMEVETKKILDNSIEVSATCVRVPVFNCHAVSVNVEFLEDFDMDDINMIFSDSDDLILLDRVSENIYATQVECSKSDAVFVSRLRRDTSVKSGLNMWVVADNLRKGAALNAVQIAFLMIESKII
ncbi:aspartate-semialdehyde dehydrogenase [Candidatus Deianiraea vastatrix]|uniref:Aspartate-semialdehyde dehydrogenase n=1 Tax=Candidatus Deianiraea vastatrix TaxID=2163644 RepID=A0A5B8XHQ5_9RICK|nr:aspartate-semialdehyde dehydrogenase [Candidatus Deianiraea vastatrix]QED23317.1 Aspartate semihaldehyde dehydrogenase [Candidatus Deianiraea vastatrix]